MTVSNWIDRWTAAHLVGKSVGHARSYKDLCTVLKERVGEMRIRDVKEIDLQPILSGYAGKSKSLLKKVRDTIRSVFTAAYRNGLIRTNPAAALVLPSGTYTGHRALEPWEVERS